MQKCMIKFIIRIKIMICKDIDKMRNKNKLRNRNRNRNYMNINMKQMIKIINYIVLPIIKLHNCRLLSQSIRSIVHGNRKLKHQYSAIIHNPLKLTNLPINNPSPPNNLLTRNKNTSITQLKFTHKCIKQHKLLNVTSIQQITIYRITTLFNIIITDN